MTEDATSYLVTGATGFIGRRLVTRLAEEGDSVFCLVSRDRDQVSRLPQIQGITSIVLQPSGPLRAALAETKAEVVINLAAQGVDPKSRDPESIMGGNAGVLINLISALEGLSPRVILHAGSWSEYAATNGAAPIRESDPIAPTSIYGAAKASASLVGTALARVSGIPFVTLRLFNVFGVGEPPNRLIPYLIDRLRKSVHADLTPGDQTRDLTYVDDVVEAILLASRSTLEPFTAYNVCSSRPTEVRWIAEKVAEIMDKPRTLLHFGAMPHRADEPMSVVGDNSRFVSATGWHPRVAVDDGIRLMVAALRSGETVSD